MRLRSLEFVFSAGLRKVCSVQRVALRAQATITIVGNGVTGICAGFAR